MNLNYFLIVGYEFNTISFENWDQILCFAGATFFTILLIISFCFTLGILTLSKNLQILKPITEHCLTSSRIAPIYIICKWTLQWFLLSFFVNLTLITSEIRSMCIISIIMIITSVNCLFGKCIYKHWVYFVFEFTLDLSNSVIMVMAHFEGLYYSIDFNTIAIVTCIFYVIIGEAFVWGEILIHIWEVRERRM